MSGVLIVLGQFGYRVYSWVESLPQFCMNIPFAIYILSPAIASYIVLKKNNKIVNFQEWLKPFSMLKQYISLFVCYCRDCIVLFNTRSNWGHKEMLTPFYAFFLSLPGNLFIGGLRRPVGRIFTARA